MLVQRHDTGSLVEPQALSLVGDTWVTEVTQFIPTVSLDVMSLVASSCGHYRGHIEPRVAQ